MKTRPIIFSGPMVNALLAGRKTMTRRIVKPQPDARCDRVLYDPAIGWRFRYDSNRQCPYGVPGDLLWVRETWRQDDYDEDGCIYRCDMPQEALDDCKGIIKWRPSIFMPRRYSRITLRVTDVRVERVQEISSDDCIAEGVGKPVGTSLSYGSVTERWNRDREFAPLWNSINGPDSWVDNPWVWCVSFEKQNEAEA